MFRVLTDGIRRTDRAEQGAGRELQDGDGGGKKEEEDCGTEDV